MGYQHNVGLDQIRVLDHGFRTSTQAERLTEQLCQGEKENEREREKRKNNDERTEGLMSSSMYSGIVPK